MQVISFLAYILIETFVRPLFSFFEMETLFCWALGASVLILTVLLLRFLLRERISCQLRYVLWLAVAARLLLPLQLPISLPWSTQALTPEVPQSWEKPTVPIFPGKMTSVEEAHPYYSDFEPGYLGPGPWSSGYVRISDDGITVTTYSDLYTPNEVIQLVWLAGALGMGVVLIWSNARFARGLEKRRKLLTVENCPLPVYVAEDLPSPCLFGVLWPCVYLMPDAAADETVLRHVLAHELTHYAHKDHLWAAARCLCLALHWYNPLVWLAAGLSKRDGELACDEGAIARLGEAERIPYGRTLVDMVAARSGRPADLFSCSTSMTGGKKSIQQRVALLVKRPETAKTALFIAVSAVVLAAVFVFAGRTDNDPQMFLSCLERADAIRYSPFLLSSFFYPDPIADEDLMAEAKAALSTLTYLSDDDPQPDLTGWNTINQERIVLLFDGGEMEYSLLWQNNRTYLFPGNIWEQSQALKEEKGEDAQLQGVSGACVSKEGVSVPWILEHLARRQMNRDLYAFSLDDVSSYYDQYHSQLSAAQGMRRNSPMLHNNRIITDPDQLKRARELLALEPLTEEEIFRQWDGDWVTSISFTSNIPTPDWTGTDDGSPSYYVSWEDGWWYILLPTERKEGELNSGIYLGKLSEENWGLADELFEQAPTVDERIHTAEFYGSRTYSADRAAGVEWRSIAGSS